MCIRGSGKCDFINCKWLRTFDFGFFKFYVGTQMLTLSAQIFNLFLTDTKVRCHFFVVGKN